MCQSQKSEHTPPTPTTKISHSGLLVTGFSIPTHKTLSVFLHTRTEAHLGERGRQNWRIDRPRFLSVALAKHDFCRQGGNAKSWEQPPSPLFPGGRSLTMSLLE